jgi:type IV pilus assembly protein PilQ
MAVQPVWAAPVEVTGVKLNPTSGGFDLLLQTKPGDRPQVFAVNRSNSWTADITSTQLRLPEGNSFSRDNPAPGIARVTVAPLNANSVRVTVVGQGNAPVGQVVRPSAGGLLLSLSLSGSRSATRLPDVPQIKLPDRSAPPPKVIAQANPPAPAPAPSAAPPAPGSRSAPMPTINSPTPPLVPNPKIEVQGGTPSVPIQVNPPLPSLPRAIAPPVGDVAISQFNPAANAVDLGTAERVPRLVLRDAPAREVLSLLARAAGLNLAYAPPRATGQGGQTQAQPQAGAAGGRAGSTSDEGPKVTLDIENEAVQDVFNTVLQITGLEANRVGRTVYVSPRLPDDARNVITRTLRLNQANATAAANFLVSQGAELQLPITRETVVTLGTGVNAQNTILREPDIKVIKAQPGNAPLPLSGLAVSADARLNAVVISGVPRKVEVASALLSQLDARRRQVTVNVRVIDMNLSNFEQAGFSFSFGIGANRFINQGGLGIFNFGTSVPATVTVPTQVGASPIGAIAPGSLTTPLNNFVSNFFAQLQLQVTNGNAKILTDPTLVVQEGQQATVNLTQEVISNVKVETSGGGISGGTGTVTVTTEKANVGVTLGINVDRIDDNGFVTLSLNPVVSAPTQTFNVTIPGFGGSPASSQQITLVQQRSLSSGLLRLRDGQTLIAAGIIQDGDRSEITKIPILGDIPILGALFRRNVRTNQRNEVIILLTPRILDDTDRSSFGYNYTPGPGVRQILEQPR